MKLAGRYFLQHILYFSAPIGHYSHFAALLKMNVSSQYITSQTNVWKQIFVSIVWAGIINFALQINHKKPAEMNLPLDPGRATPGYANETSTGRGEPWKRRIESVALFCRHSARSWQLHLASTVPLNSPVVGSFSICNT